jgi:hypothetical protein
MTQDVTLTPGQMVEVWGRGDFFRLMEASQTVSITYYLNGKQVAQALNVRTGYAEGFDGEGFDRFAIVNGATAQTIKVVARLGSSVQYDVPPVGNVAVTNTSLPVQASAARSTADKTFAGYIACNMNGQINCTIALQNPSTSGKTYAITKIKCSLNASLAAIVGPLAVVQKSTFAGAFTGGVQGPVNTKKSATLLPIDLRKNASGFTYSGTVVSLGAVMNGEKITTLTNQEDPVLLQPAETIVIQLGNTGAAGANDLMCMEVEGYEMP